MQTHCRTASSHTLLRGIAIAALTLVTSAAVAQQSKPGPCGDPQSQALKTFYLTNAAQQNEANEILVALRNTLQPCVKIYLVASQNAIVIESSADQIAQAESLIHELDRPKKLYRLTFTITDFDGSNKIGTRHYSLVAAQGQRATMKQGSKVPIATGKFDVTSTISETQNTYIDVGMNIDITVTSYAGGVELKSRVEQSSIGEEKSEIGPHDPIVHQTVIDSVSSLTLGKPLTLGTLDVPDSTRHMDISVLAEALP
jgi:type II secretory pathway component GspD/PulD (secretin)